MEVHAHSHTERKKWHHYFWEFFMLFLAVSSGFFVENQREHYVERIWEKEYIHSILDDLKTDTAWINQFLIDQGTSINYYDSVLVLLNKPNRTKTEQQRMYYLVRMAMRLSWPNKANTNAYEQMKNSGNLRLFHDHEIGEKVSEYYFKLNEIAYITELMTLRQQAETEYEGKIFDGNVFQQMIDKETFVFEMPENNPSLITNDKMILNEFNVRVHYLSSIMTYSINFAKNQYKEANELIALLKKEYHIE